MNTTLSQDTKQPMWLHLLVAEITCIVFFLPAARFHLTFFGFSITTGYEMYKVFYIPILTWLYWRWHNREKPFPSSPFFLPLVVFFCISVFSSLSCVDMYESLTESLEILLYIIFFLILLDIPWDTRYLTWAAGGFVIGHLYLGVLTLYQFLSASSFGAIRANGNFTHPNELGVYCTLGLPLLLWLALSARSTLHKSLIGLAAALTCSSAVFTLSRGTYLSFFIGGLVLFGCGTQKMKKGVLIALAVFVMVVFLWNPGIVLRMNTIFQHPTVSDNPPPRTHIWAYLMKTEIPGLPFYGIGMQKLVTERMAANLASADDAFTIETANGPHNQYVSLLVTLGPAGLFVFLWLAGLFFVHGRACKRDVAAVFLAGLAAFLFNSVFEVPILASNIPIAIIILMTIVTKQKDKTAPCPNS